ncbi:HFX_2341 family transcriptional regulator [Halobaculum sp. EA56]|uniref:HFX_2341 family transcriptional regulator n=1 Tax=Halobaculum sp. EA56 TaxID=3421648 RepID=UPI003EB948CA
MQTHVVPVGFDYDRLIAPLVRDQFDVDRVVLLEGAVGSEANVEYSRNLSQKLETDFRNLLGAETERVPVADVYDYDAAFEQAYDLINGELDAGREVWVNVSSMPRPVSFAFATAAHSVTLERQADRDRIHTYYTAPEKYLETELAEELRADRDLLRDLLAAVEEGDAEGGSEAAVADGADASDAVEVDRVRERLSTATDLLAEFDERGTTIGAKEVNGSHIIELPVASFSNVKPFEEVILFKLGEHGEFESVSELAKALAAELNEEYTDSFRSKVIYNVDRLGPGGKGYVEQESHGKSYRTRLSRIGELWVRAHTADDASDYDW